jgi:maltose alpha-D-glucosyltransferase/alpha-amylase
VPLDAGGGGRAEIRFRKRERFDTTPVPERLVVRRASGEQSNSSILFEEFGLLKLYRRLQPGPHPEIEVSSYLVEQAGFANTPTPLATLDIEIAAPDGTTEECALGVLFGFVRNQGDGWTLALDYLARYLDDALIETAPGAGPPGRPHELPDPDSFFLALARQLGLRTAEMHRAFAEKAGDAVDFAPEPITRDDLVGWRNALEASADMMLAQLERSRAKLPETVVALVDRVVDRQNELFACIRALAPEEVVAVKTRYHGDFHLGQVIAVQNDFYIVDFEGEPLRPMAERRMKASVLRDVAGMIRSFDYAATAAVRQLAQGRPGALDRMTMLAEAWRERAVNGFRAAYRRAMRGCPAYPASKLQARALIEFFTLEKAVYEVGYELANRPDWVAIPLNGILRVLNKVSGSDNAASA